MYQEWQCGCKSSRFGHTSIWDIVLHEKKNASLLSARKRTTEPSSPLPPQMIPALEKTARMFVRRGSEAFEKKGRVFKRWCVLSVRPAVRTVWKEIRGNAKCKLPACGTGWNTTTSAGGRGGAAWDINSCTISGGLLTAAAPWHTFHFLNVPLKEKYGANG